MLDPGSEELITLQAAAGRLPCRRAGRPTHPATLHRWRTQGLRGVRLESVRVGGVLCTSEAALVRFFDALSEGPKQVGGMLHKMAHEAACEHLRAIGMI